MVLALLRATTLPSSPLNVAFVIGFFVLSALNAGLFFLGRRRTVVPLHDAPVVFDGAGVSIGGQSALTIAWRDVERVIDVGDAILILRRGLRAEAIAIPKRECGDGGRALWSFFEGRLLGRRLLGRPRRSDPIVNVASA